MWGCSGRGEEALNWLVEVVDNHVDALGNSVRIEIMASELGLKFHSALRDEDSMVFERRGSPRCEPPPGVGSFMAIMTGEQGIGMVPIQLVDISVSGLGFSCTKPIEPGTRISLSPAANPIPDNIATVSRCIPTAEGFSVGLRYDAQAVA